MPVSDLKLAEAVCLNTERLEDICNALGYSGGETAICAAMEDLAAMLQEATVLWRAAEPGALRTTARQIADVADRIGMVGLSGVAGDVATLCGGADDPALAATVARMRRLGEQSLLAIWDRQDQSI